ncbi:MAG TPA: ribosomal L7Ae/L30e/S12e/Gadd45 family protein [Candidatus Nanoarchaeia archaeon]|nr:ribosomal L7Ae/L30e/S12e/Gadd45 family protein [Candidatus Nanoarchaeia archaeon]
MEDIKKLVKEKKVFIGKDQTLKNLRLGKVSKVLLASNCPAELKETIERYSKMSGASVEQLDVPNDELGILCRKHFFISVMGVKK